MSGYLEVVTSQLMRQYSEKMDQVIKSKLHMLERKSLEYGETELAYVLNGLDLNGFEKTKSELEKRGYIIELEYPPANFQLKENIIKAIIEADKVKIKVKKLVIEI